MKEFEKKSQSYSEEIVDVGGEMRALGFDVEEPVLVPKRQLEEETQKSKKYDDMLKEIGNRNKRYPENVLEVTWEEYQYLFLARSSRGSSHLLLLEKREDERTVREKLHDFARSQAKELGREFVEWTYPVLEARRPEVMDNPSKYFALITLDNDTVTLQDLKGTPKNDASTQYDIPDWVRLCMSDDSAGLLVLEHFAEGEQTDEKKTLTFSFRDILSRRDIKDECINGQFEIVAWRQLNSPLPGGIDIDNCIRAILLDL